MGDYSRILLTGGSGFVGSYVAPALAERYPAAALHVLTRPGETCKASGWKPCVADLVDEEAIEKAVSELVPDLVVHLAGQASVGRAYGAAELTWRVNFHGTFNIAAALARHAPSATFFFTSSASVYGASLKEEIATESTPLRPLDTYGRTKAAAEAALSDILGPGSRLIIARPVNHSGPRQHDRHFVLSSFAAQIAAIEAGRQPPLMQVGDISRSRDFLDVRDVVRAYLQLIEAAPGFERRINIFNVGSGQPRTISSLLEALRALTSIDIKVTVDPGLLRPTDLQSIACDPTLIRKTTGWRPRHTIDDMLSSLLDYWRGVEQQAAQ